MGLFDQIKKKKDTELDRYIDGYRATGRGLGGALKRLFQGFRGVSDDFLEDLTRILLEADVGIDTTVKIVDSVRQDNKKSRIQTAEDCREALGKAIEKIYDAGSIAPIHYSNAGTTVILITGVNGAGKTTTIAKLAKYYQDQGKSVALAAGDTFRAGAREQLQLWANRLGVPCIAGKEKSDPASVMVDACRYSQEHKIDILLCDTAGRLQNKANLMAELQKITRVIGKTISGQPMESWLVIDATTGQNGLAQARSFMESAHVSGIILSKFDGSGKGGVVLAIRDRWKLPVRFIGTGETERDLAPFAIEDFASSIWEGMEEEDA